MSYPEDALLKEQRYVGAVETLSPIKHTTRQRLETMKRETEKYLERINKAITALDNNPELEEFHNALNDVL